MLEQSIVVFVENETWMSYLEEMYVGLLGNEKITQFRKSKYETLIKSNDYYIRIFVGLREYSRGYKADLVLNLVHNDENRSANDLQELNNTTVYPIMSMRDRRKLIREEQQNV